MSRADIQAGAAFVRIYAKTSELAHGLVFAENRLKSFGINVEGFVQLLAKLSPVHVINKITDSISALGHAIADQLHVVGDSLASVGKKSLVAGVALSSPLLAAVGHFAHTGDALWVLSQRTGVTTQALSGLGFAARQTGASIDEVETGIRMMQKTIGDAANGSVEAKEALGKLTLSVEELLSLSPDQQFEKIADGLSRIQDQSLRTSAAVDVLGRSGQSLLPMMLGLRGFMAEASRLGLIVSPEQAELAEQVIDKFQALKEAVFAVAFAVGEALGNSILDAIREATELAIRFRAWVADNKETVQLIARIAGGLVAAGAAATTLGIAMKLIGSVVGTMASAFAIFGSAVASVAGILGVVSLLTFIVAKFTAVSAFVAGMATAPIATFSAAIASAGAALAAAFSGGTVGIIGLIGSTLAAVFWEIILPAIAIVAGIAAAIAAMTAAAAVAAVVFWKLADPLKAIMPTALAAFEAIKKIGQALFAGDFEGAANAAIDGMKQVLVRGTLSIMQMMKTAMERLPGFIANVFSGVGNATSAVTRTIARLFREMWPAIKASFTAILSLAKDVFDQLPAIAAYTLGRLVRAIVVGLFNFLKFSVKAIVNTVIGMFWTLVELVPKLVKAMVTGGVRQLVSEVTKAFAVVGGLVAGVTLGDAPAFKPSDNTVAAWKELGSQVEQVKASINEPAKGDAGKGSGSGPGDGAVSTELAELPFDATPVQRFDHAIAKLYNDFETGQISLAKFNEGLHEIHTELLGLEKSPLQRYREQVELLAAAHQHMSPEQFAQKMADAKREILGLDPGPIGEFEDQLAKLNLEMEVSGMSSEEYSRRLRQMQESIFGLETSPVDALSDRLATLGDRLARNKISILQWADGVEAAKRTFLGIDDTALEKFQKRIEEIDASILDDEDKSKAKNAAKDEFLNLPKDEIEEYKKRIAEIDAADLSPEDKAKAKEAALPDSVRRIREQIKTEAEKLKDELDKLKQMRDADLLSDEEYAKRKEQLEKEFDEKNKKKEKDRSQSPFVTYSGRAASMTAAGGIAALGRREGKASVRPGDIAKDGADGAKGVATVAGAAAADGMKSSEGTSLSVLKDIKKEVVTFTTVCQQIANGLRGDR